MDPPPRGSTPPCARWAGPPSSCSTPSICSAQRSSGSSSSTSSSSRPPSGGSSSGSSIPNAAAAAAAADHPAPAAAAADDPAPAEQQQHQQQQHQQQTTGSPASFRSPPLASSDKVIVSTWTKSCVLVMPLPLKARAPRAALRLGAFVGILSPHHGDGFCGAVVSLEQHRLLCCKHSDNSSRVCTY